MKKLAEGDVFTIAGVKRAKNGEIITNCKPGAETKFVAKTSGHVYGWGDPRTWSDGRLFADWLSHGGKW